jgi:hypothetical protein
MARPRKDAITSDMARSSDGYEGGKFVELPENKKSNMKLYVSPHQKQGFKVPIIGNDGKHIMLTRPGTNMPVFINGRPVTAMRDCSFKTQSNNIKRGCLSYYETEDPAEIEVLEALSADPSTEILTEEQYLRKKDPDKFELKKKIEEQGELISTQTNVISDLEAQLKRLTGE